MAYVLELAPCMIDYAKASLR